MDDDDDAPTLRNGSEAAGGTDFPDSALGGAFDVGLGERETKDGQSSSILNKIVPLVMPINNEEIPSAPPSDMDDIVPILDGNGNPLDMRDGTDTSCCTRCNYSCCNSLSCLWKESLEMYIFYGFVDLG